MPLSLTPLPSLGVVLSRGFGLMISGGFLGAFLTGVAVAALGAGIGVIGAVINPAADFSWSGVIIFIPALLALSLTVMMFSWLIWLAGTVLIGLPALLILHVLGLRSQWHLIATTAVLAGLVSAYLFRDTLIVHPAFAAVIGILGGVIGRFAYNGLYGAAR